MKYKGFIWICGCVWVLCFAALCLAAQLPQEVKQRLIVYPGAKLTNLENNALGDGRQIYDIDLQAERAAYKDVVSFYRQEAKKRKWKILNDTDRGYSCILICHDGRYKIDITIMTRENKVFIRLTIMG